MPYAVNPAICDTQTRKAMQKYLDECSLETPEEVAQFFTAYTYLIWDYQLFGEIHRVYTGDILLHYADHDVQGVANVILETLEAKRGMTFAYKHIFVDIFAEGDPERGYHFIQSTSYHFDENGPCEWDGCVLPQNHGNCMCECEVRKVDGRWIIVQEWMC